MAIPEGVSNEGVEENVTDINEVRDQKDAENAQPLEGAVKEYDPGRSLSEEEMSKMEHVKDENTQEGFDKYARETEREKARQENVVMRKLREFLGGK